MSTTWHFYDPDTGLFVGRSFSGPQRALELNTPPGCEAWPCAPGDLVDELSQRVDLSGEEPQLVDHQPSAPESTELLAYTWDGEIRRWVGRPTLAAEEAKQRAERTRLLAESDWTQMPDSPLSAGVRAAWLTYRVALRDLPDQEGWPTSIVWPAPPA